MAELDSLVRSKLIFGEYFYAEEWGLPEFFTDYIDFRIDPTWHEFEAVEYTDEAVTALYDLPAFMRVLLLLAPKK